MPLQRHAYEMRRNEGGKYNEEECKPEISGEGSKRKQGGFWGTDYDASGISVQIGLYVYEERTGCLGCSTGMRYACNDLYG